MHREQLVTDSFPIRTGQHEAVGAKFKADREITSLLNK